MFYNVYKSWLKNFINLIYPLSCLICGIKVSPISNKPLCEDCWGKIILNLPPVCDICGKHLPVKIFVCKDCQNSSFSFEKAYSVCKYDGVIKDCIHLLKYNSKLSLAPSLGRLMTDFTHRFLNMDNTDLILPVPLHRVKLRQRQFNQAQVLAESISSEFKKPLAANVLIRAAAGTAQVGLNRNERFKNIKNAFRVAQPKTVKNKNILLVDDVMTTGATADECARTLLKTGAKKIEVITLARNA